LPHNPIESAFQRFAIYTSYAVPTRRNPSTGCFPHLDQGYADRRMDIVTLQEKISRIDGVAAVRVVADNSHLAEIHVLARRTKPPKQLVRDVQSLAQAMFGLEIDRRIVSVVQLADTDLETGFRPALVDVAESLDGSRAQITVTLRWQESLLVGKTTGAAATATRPRQIAEATLEAVRQAINPEAALAMSSMDIPILGSRRVAVAQVVLVTEATERMLIGSAFVEDDETRAVVRAVLDALNRLLPDLKTP
jgi:hypothetical protein